MTTNQQIIEFEIIGAYKYTPTKKSISAACKYFWQELIMVFFYQLMMEIHGLV